MWNMIISEIVIACDLPCGSLKTVIIASSESSRHLLGRGPQLRPNQELQ